MSKLLDSQGNAAPVQVRFVFMTSAMYACYGDANGLSVLFSVIRRSDDLSSCYLMVTTSAHMMQGVVMQLKVMLADEEFLCSLLETFHLDCEVRMHHGYQQGKNDFTGLTNIFVTPGLFDFLQKCAYISDDAWQELQRKHASAAPADETAGRVVGKLGESPRGTT